MSQMRRSLLSRGQRPLLELRPRRLKVKSAEAFVRQGLLQSYYRTMKQGGFAVVARDSWGAMGLAFATLAVVLAGCDKASVPQPPKPRNQILSSQVFTINLDDREARALMKHFPSEPELAADALDSEGCRRAGGEWAPFISGPLIERPKVGEHADGMMCWSKRPPKQFADGGKRCRGQSDCLGNCRSESQKDGKWSLPVCQRDVAENTCGPIFDGGQFHWVTCAVP